MSELPQEMTFRYANSIEIYKPVGDCHQLLMNTLIISSFSGSFEDFERDVTGFITDIGKDVFQIMSSSK